MIALLLGQQDELIYGIHQIQKQTAANEQMKKEWQNWNEGSSKAANIMEREATRNDMPPADGQLPVGVLGEKKEPKSVPSRLQIQ